MVELLLEPLLRLLTWLLLEELPEELLPEPLLRLVTWLLPEEELLELLPEDLLVVWLLA